MKVKIMLLLVLAALLLPVSLAQAEKLLCISTQTLKGEKTVDSCLATGERFAMVDQYGFAKVLSPEEVELTRPFNPKLFESKAFGVQYYKQAVAAELSIDFCADVTESGR